MRVASAAAFLLRDKAVITFSLSVSNNAAKPVSLVDQGRSYRDVEERGEQGKDRDTKSLYVDGEPTKTVTES